jgi:hypothetical protein
MKPPLGYIMVIEKVVESGDLTYRLYGSFIASRYAEDRTGQNLTVRNVGMAQFSMPLVSRPCTARNLCSRGTHRHLILPFSCHAEAAEILVVANVAHAAHSGLMRIFRPEN